MVWRSRKGNHVLDLHLKEWGVFSKQKEEQQSSPRNNILKVIVIVLDFDYLFQDDNTLNMIEFYSSWKDEVEDEFPSGPFQEMFGILQESVQTSVDSRKPLNILETTSDIWHDPICDLGEKNIPITIQKMN